MQGFDRYSEECQVCTDFVGEFMRDNEDAVDVHGEVDGRDHTWAYDPTTDKTVDATLSQFDGFVPGAERDKVFEGDEHPLAEEKGRFDTLEEFAEGPGGMYLLDR